LANPFVFDSNHPATTTAKNINLDLTLIA